MISGEKNNLAAKIAVKEKQLRSMRKRLRYLELVERDPSALLVEEAWLSMRLWNLLHGTRFKTLRDLSELTDVQMLSIDGVGVKLAAEIRDVLLEAGVQRKAKKKR